MSFAFSNSSRYRSSLCCSSCSLQQTIRHVEHHPDERCDRAGPVANGAPARDLPARRPVRQHDAKLCADRLAGLQRILKARANEPEVVGVHRLEERVEPALRKR